MINRGQGWPALRSKKINKIIEAAEAAMHSSDPALIEWAGRNLECALEDLGETLRGWHRRTHSRFALARAEAVEWEAENRRAWVEEGAKLSEMLDRIIGFDGQH